MKCGTCDKEIEGMAVCSPTTDVTKQHRCIDCAKEDMKVNHTELCKKLFVPQEICYIALDNEKHSRTHQKDGYVSSRGDMVILDFNDKNELVGIELVGKGKPCQGFKN